MTRERVDIYFCDRCGDESDKVPPSEFPNGWGCVQYAQKLMPPDLEDQGEAHLCPDCYILFEEFIGAENGR